MKNNIELISAHYLNNFLHRWIDEPAKKFQIVEPNQLARLWARLKENPTMDWARLQKVLELYLRKNFIRASDTGHVYTFTMEQKKSER